MHTEFIISPPKTPTTFLGPECGEEAHVPQHRDKVIYKAFQSLFGMHPPNVPEHVAWSSKGRGETHAHCPSLPGHSSYMAGYGLQGLREKLSLIFFECVLSLLKGIHHTVL